MNYVPRGPRAPTLREQGPGKTFGPAVKFAGGPCPVAAATPVSIWKHSYWVGVNHPERIDWRGVMYWRYRYPNGRHADPERRSVELPTDEDHARAMIATARDWLERHGLEVI